MAAFLDGLATAFDGVIQTTLQATVLAALILVIQRLLRKRLAPRWHYALWLLVLLRLFLPWTPESPTSVFNYVRTEQAAPTQLLVNPGSEVILLDSYVERSAIPPLSDPPNDFAPAIPEIRLTWTDGLRLVWLGVAGLLLPYVCVVNGSLWWRVRREPVIDDGAVATEFAACCQLMGVRARIRLVRTRYVSTPALLGLLRPRLLLPESMERTLTQEELRHVFLHELAHYRRGDLIVNWLMVACNIVHWFNPALWYAFHRMRSDRELACDALAMSYIAPDETSSYGRTLLRLLEHVARARPLPGLVGVLERKSHLKKRIRGIAGFKPGSYRWSFLAVALIAVLSAVALTNASTGAEKSPQVAVALEDSDPMEFPVPSELKLEAGDSSKHEVDLSAPEPSIKVETEDRTITAESVQLDLESMRLDLITTVPLETNAEQDPRLRDLGGELQLATPENRRDLNVALVAQSVDLNTQRNDETKNPSGRPIVEDKDAEVSHGEAPQQKDGNVDAATSPPTEEEEWPDPPVLVRFGEGNTITADSAKLDTDNLLLELGGTIVVDRDTGPDMRITNGTAKLDLAESRKGALSDVKGDNVEVFQVLPPEAPKESEKVFVLLGSGRRVLILHTDGAFMANSLVLDVETNEITLTGYVQFNSYGVRDGVADKVTFNYVTGETQMEGIRIEGMDLSRSESAESPAKVEKQDDTQDTPPPNPDVVAKLKAPVSLEFENERLFRIVALISMYARVAIVIDNEVVAPVGETPSDDPPHATDSMVPYVKLNDVPLQDALKAILRPLGLAFEVRGDTVYISTPDRLRAQEAVDDAHGRETIEDVTVSVSFNKETTLMEAAAKLIDAADVNIVVDGRVVSPDDGTSSDPTDWIVQPKKYKDTPLIDVLREMLEPLGLTFSTQPGFIWISTPDRIATESFEELETRTYPLERIPALTAAAASRETFLATIRRMVRVTEPDTGKAMSHVVVDEDLNTLEVHSSPSYLDQLEQFLLNALPPRTIEGTVTDAEGKPVADATPGAAGNPQVSSSTEAVNTPPKRFTVEFQSYRISRRDLERTIEGWTGISDAEVLYGAPRILSVPPLHANPENVVNGLEAVELGKLVTRMTYGSTAKYALSLPKGNTELPGFDLFGYFGYASNYRTELVRLNEGGDYETVPWPDSRRLHTDHVKHEYLAIFPGLEAGPNDTLLLEVLWQSLEELPGIGEVPPQHSALVKYPVKPGQWTAIAFPKTRSQHYLVFARVTESAETFDAATAVAERP